MEQGVRTLLIPWTFGDALDRAENQLICEDQPICRFLYLLILFNLK